MSDQTAYRKRHFTIVCLSLLLLGTAVSAQPTTEPSPQSSPIISNQEREELEHRRLTDEMRDRISTEVDRAFARTTTILNVLLVILTLFPLAIALGIWLSRRSIFNQVATQSQQILLEEIRPKLQQETAQELKNQIETIHNEIKNIKTETESYLRNLVLDSQNVLDKMSHQKMMIALQELEQLTAQHLATFSHVILSTPTPNNSSNNITKTDLEDLEPEQEQPESEITRYIKTGNSLVSLNRYHEAIDAYEKGLEIEPEHYEIWYYRGNALKNLHQYNQAIDSYDRAIEIKSDYHQAWDDRGYILVKLGLYSQATTSLNHALEIQPDYANTYYNKAFCYAAQNQVELTIKNLQQAIYLDQQYQETVKNDPNFASIRKTERFRTFMEQY